MPVNPPATLTGGLLLLVGLAGCAQKDDTGTPGDDSTPTGGDDSSTTDSNPVVPTSACAAGGWGAMPDDPAVAFHVRADGDDTNAGTWDAPFASLDAAVAATRAEGAAKVIFVGPGTYDAQLNLAHSIEDGTDDGLAIYGCGRDEVTFDGASNTDPVVKVSQVAGFVLDGVTLHGGRRALWIWQGATATISNVSVSESRRSGVVIDGSETFTSAIELEVADTVAEASGSGSEIGYGISVQLGTLEMTGGRVTGSTGVGVLVHFGSLAMEGTTVEHTAPDSSGYLGRGIQLQELSDGALTNVGLSDNADAGIFALRALVTDLEAVTVTNTVASGIPSTGVAASTGDGVVITQGDANYDVASFQANVNDSTVDGSDRAGVVVDSVTVLTCAGNAVTGNGYPSDGTPQIIVQGDAVMPDPDISDDWTLLDVPIPVNELSLTLDDLTE